MLKRILFVVMATAVVLSGGIAVNSAYAGSARVNWSVAGTIVPVGLAIPTGQEIFTPPALLIQAVAKGAPGDAQFSVVSFTAPAEGFCNGGGFSLAFVQNDVVFILHDQSMLFATLDPSAGASGACIQEDTFAVVYMKVVGGTGKFENASGAFIGTFVGRQVGASGALSAETGTIEGSIHW